MTPRGPWNWSPYATQRPTPKAESLPPKIEAAAEAKATPPVAA
jgi:hypothetical protein